ncbi:MAG: hypothetical protein IPP80_09750 [Ignavibacteria bacterium]|nr:hypothetical protein [Ignavibacteria bacterium]
MASPERRAAGLFMIRADAAHWADHDYRERIYRLIDRGVGGVGVFLGGLEETASMIEDLQRRGGRRLIIAADYEHGLPMRLDGGIAFPRAMALGRTLPGITEHVAACIAIEASAIGVHWNWAPVADINSDPNNPIINTRSFGETAEVVAAHAAAYVRGTQSRGVMACAKHAPGHGDTHVDSHVSMPTIDVSVDVARLREFIPFRACIDAGVRSVMVAHIVVPFLDGTLPASLSHEVVTGLIRNEWGFTGLITTDAMDMKAIDDTWSSAEASLLAIKAGVDVVLMPSNPNAAIDAVLEAITTGAISEEQLSASEARWDDARAYVGLRSRTAGSYASRERVVVDQSTHAMIALKAADAALRLEGNLDLLPITQYTQAAVFAVIDEAEADAATTWFQSLAQATELNVDFGYIDGSISDQDLEALQSGITEAECVVFAFFGKAVAFRGRLAGMDRIPNVMKRLAGERPIIVVACGSPYGIEELPADLQLYTYSDTLPSLAASVMRLIGRVVSEN